MVKIETMHRAIKYRLFPNEEQEIQINRTFGCVRKVYNMGLEMQMGLYASGFKTMSKTDMNNYCNRAWKTEFPFLREVDKLPLPIPYMTLTPLTKTSSREEQNSQGSNQRKIPVIPILQISRIKTFLLLEVKTGKGS